MKDPLRLTAFASSPERESFLHARKLCGCAGSFAAMPRLHLRGGDDQQEQTEGAFYRSAAFP